MPDSKELKGFSKTFLSQAFIAFEGIPNRGFAKVFNEIAENSGKAIPHPELVSQYKERNFYTNLDVFTEQEKFEILYRLSQVGVVGNINLQRKDFGERLHREYSHWKKDGRFEVFHETVEKTKHFLGQYPKALDRYNLASEQFYQEIDPQTVVNCLWHALEELMREIQGRDWQWDKSRKELEIKFKGKMNPQFVGIFFHVLDSYALYQNESARHRNNIDLAEVELVFEMSSVFLRQIVKLYKVDP